MADIKSTVAQIAVSAAVGAAVAVGVGKVDAPSPQRTQAVRPQLTMDQKAAVEAQLRNYFATHPVAPPEKK